MYAPAQEDSSALTFAGVMWILCLIRDLLMIPFIIFGSFLLALMFGAIGLVLLVFPVIGIIGCALAITSDFGKKNHNLGTIGGIMALIGSSFPGVFLGFGGIGFTLALIGLILHVVGKKHFRQG